MTQRRGELRHGFAGNLNIAYTVQGYETIRLHRDRSLVELRTQLERQVECIPGLNAVARIARLELWTVRRLLARIRRNSVGTGTSSGTRVCLRGANPSAKSSAK